MLYAAESSGFREDLRISQLLCLPLGLYGLEGKVIAILEVIDGKFPIEARSDRFAFMAQDLGDDR